MTEVELLAELVDIMGQCKTLLSWMLGTLLVYVVIDAWPWRWNS